MKRFGAAFPAELAGTFRAAFADLATEMAMCRIKPEVVLDELAGDSRVGYRVPRG